MSRVKERLRSMLNNAKERFQAPVVRSGTVGRPRYDINADQLLMFHHPLACVGCMIQITHILRDKVSMLLEQLHCRHMADFETPGLSYTTNIIVTSAHSDLFCNKVSL